MKKQFFYGLLAGLILGGSAMGLVLSSPGDGPECVESSRLLVPTATAFSEDGINWDTTFTYCPPK